MGYCMKMIKCNFFILAGVKDEALAEVKKLMERAATEGNGGVFSKEFTHRAFSWVETNKVMEAKTLEEALAEWRYEPYTDSSGNITSVHFTGEKFGQEYLLFEVLAPFVLEGSYIQMQGEDGAVWQWVFKDGKCIELDARFT